MPQPARTALDSAIEVLPEALACASCASALAAPAWPGFDLLRTAGVLYFVELPLSVITLFSGVLRIEDASMARGTKAAFVAMPALVLGFLATVMLGAQGLAAVLWLSLSSLYRVMRGLPARGPAVPGFWITYETGDGAASMRASGIAMAARAGARGKAGRTWKVQGGADQLDAAVTLTLSMVVAAVVYFLPLGSGAATTEYGELVGWNQTVLGAIVSPASALWAGALLFGIRTLSKLGALEERAPPTPRIEDDPVLAEIVRKVDGGRRRK